MRKLRLTKFLILSSAFLSILFFNGSLKAQDCTETLTQARNSFNDGNIEVIPAMLEPCIKSGFSKEEKVQAYKLLIQAYLFEDNIVEAEKTLLKLKKANPVYEIDYENDVAEFISLFKEYQTTAFLAFGPVFGLNSPIFQIIEPFSTSSLTEDKYKPTYTRTGTNIHGGLRIIYQPYQNIEIMFEPMYMSSSYQYLSTWEDWFGNEVTIDFTESMSFLHFPVSVAYNYPVRDFIPYGFAGFDIAMMLKTEITTPIFTHDTEFEGSKIDLGEYRNTLSKNLVVGLGVKYKFLPLIYVFVEARDHIALDHMVVTTNRYSFDNERTGAYRNIDDDFKMYNFMINAGFVYSFYKHKKIN